MSNRDVDGGASDFAHLDYNSQQSVVDLSDIAISIQPDAIGTKDYATANVDAENPTPPGPNADKSADVSGHLSKINEADSEIMDDCQSEVQKGLQNVIEETKGGGATEGQIVEENKDEAV